MIIERELDCPQIYRQKRQELVEMARGLSEDQLDTMVPATPEWRVHDVLAHLVGITADLNAGRFTASPPGEWTRIQVEARRDRSIDELAAEWEREGPRFEEGLGLFGYELGSHYIGDLLQHTQDINQALGRERIRDDDALIAALDFYLDSFHETLRQEGLGVSVGLPDQTWSLGASAPCATVEGERFEIFRALGGRRSERQVRALPWSGDVDAVMPYVSRYSLPADDIVER